MCQAVIVDNSVLAELVSAVRAWCSLLKSLNRCPKCCAINCSRCKFPCHLKRPCRSRLRRCRLSRCRLPKHLRRRRSGPNPLFEDRPVTGSVDSTSRRSQSFRLRRHWRRIIFVATRNGKQDPEKPEIVQNGQRPETMSPTGTDAVDDSDVRIVDSSNEPGASPESISPMVEPVPDPSPTVVQQAPPRLKPSPGPLPERSPVPEPSRLVKVTPLSGLRWSKVTGILARKNEAAATSASQIAIWESINADASPMENIGRHLVLQTLPQSRAEAVLQSGGRLVLAADSSMEVFHGDAMASADVRLEYGDAALIDLPQGIVIRLIKARQVIATLRWQSKASVVLQHATSGLEVHVKGGTIDLNDQPQNESSVAIARDQSIQSIPQPKRLPTWVDRPVETIIVKQPFLAQLGESRNVMGTLSEQIRTLSQNQRASEGDTRTMATLATWQAALAGENVFRMVGSRLPVVRLAALNRLAMIPGWDPRHRRIWAAVDNTMRDKQRAARFRRLIFLAQQNGAPSPAQISTMLDDLTAPDIASRALSDYLLRRFNANAKQLPIYDPTATGQSQTPSRQPVAPLSGPQRQHPAACPASASSGSAAKLTRKAQPLK